MAIKFTSVKCPECGAKTHIEEGRNQAFCSYCGTKILITNENEYIIRHVFSIIASMDKKNDSFYSIALFSLVAIPWIWLINKDNEDEIDFGDKVKIPNSLIYYSKKNYIAVESILKSVGFTNIKTVPLNDLTLGIMKRPDMVEYITINGKMPKFAFKKYHTNASIVISYHSYRKS